MKILIVDDDEERAVKLIAHLIAHAGCTHAEVDVESSGVSARDALAVTTYDLLVLDVVLPLRTGDEPNEQVAVSLLTELSETTRLRKPKHIVGLTAYEVAERENAQDFTSRSWVLVRENSLNDDWMQTIGSAVRYIRDYDENPAPPEYGVDVVIVTALQTEMEAIRRLPWDWTADEALDDCQFFAKGAFMSKGRTCSVVAAVANRMGMVSSSILVSKLIQHFHPKLVAMSGICAGVRGKANIGDVIAADMSWDYQSGKHVSTKNAISGFLMDPNFIQTNAFVSSRIDQLAHDAELAVSIQRDWIPRPLTSPALHRGPIASGSAVLADREVTESIRLQQRKLLAVEMELYGVFFAVEQASRPKPIALGIKSVCDFADDEKSDAAHPYAAYTSAAYLKEFCERYVADI
ncbi:MAG: hypothetical protein WBA47_09050 [Rhodanobacter sp.]|jgi:nucleoside phosphorylase